jgi:hypothetical protein
VLPQVGSSVLSDEQMKKATANIYKSTVPGIDRVIDKMEVAFTRMTNALSF